MNIKMYGYLDIVIAPVATWTILYKVKAKLTYIKTWKKSYLLGTQNPFRVDPNSIWQPIPNPFDTFNRI